MKIALVMGKDEQVLSIRSAARRLDVSTDTIRRKIASGELAAFRIGRAVRVAAEDVERLLAPINSPGRQHPGEATGDDADLD